VQAGSAARTGTATREARAAAAIRLRRFMGFSRGGVPAPEC
jgi:hypothetical protein